MEIVIDCSVSTAWIMPDETSNSSETLLKAITTADNMRIIQPSLWLYETLNCLKTAVLRKRLDLMEAKNALFHLHELPIEYIFPENQGKFNIIEKAIKHNLSAYDASYLDLAETRGINLYTRDKDLLKLKNEYSFIKDIRTFKKF